MLNNKVFLLVLITCLPACDNDEPQRVNIIPIQVNADDPAMKDAVFGESLDQEALDSLSFEKEKKIKKDPQVFTVDIEGKRVFFPEQGWMSAQDFWVIYYDQPEKLPADLDFERLESLKEKTRAEEGVS